MMNLIKYGWSCHDVVEVKRTGCEHCFQNRWHETAYGKTVCLACCLVTDADPKPGFIILRNSGEEIEWKG